MTRKEKQKALIFLGLAILTTVLLATSLSQMTLQPGLPPPALEGNHLIVPEFGESIQGSNHVNTFQANLLGILLILFLLVIWIAWGIGKAGRKLFINLLKVFLILAAILFVLVRILLPYISAQKPAGSPLPPVGSQFTTQLGSPPPILVGMVGVCLTILALFLFISWRKPQQKPNQADLLAAQAEKAWQSILAGQDMHEVILRCYQEMSQVLRQEAGIERQEFVTPSEYERELSSAGLPSAPVHQLTRLFEIARYGNWTPTTLDEQAALDSLAEIGVYLRERKAVGQDE